MRHFLLVAAISASVLAGCNATRDPKPATVSDADVLMKANGYWEWESSTSRGSRLTPASMGFSRQLVFKSDGKVHIYHNRQPKLQAAYQLSFEVDATCQPPQPQPVAVPMVRYTAETQFANSELRKYGIALAATDTTLYIDGVGLCTDTGAAERYRWRSK